MDFINIKEDEKKLEVLDNFDAQKEIRITVVNKFRDAHIHLTRKEVERLIEHLTNVL